MCDIWWHVRDKRKENIGENEQTNEKLQKKIRIHIHTFTYTHMYANIRNKNEHTLSHTRDYPHRDIRIHMR